MQPELWAEIKRLKQIEKLSARSIARQLKIGRRTVSNALESPFCPQRCKPERGSPSKLEPFKDYIKDRLAEYPALSSTVIFREISQRGYGGKIRILSRHVAKLKNKNNEAFLRLETLPGEYAQVDWANCGAVKVGNALRKLSCFVMTLSYSRLLYLEFTLSQCLEDFIACHINAFKFFGGVTRKILYDNLKTVVLSRLGKEARLNPRFMEFAGIYLFEPRLCNPGRGNEKGKVECNIKYIRSSFLAGKELTTAWPAINGEASLWRDSVANCRLHRTTREKPIERFELEKNHLTPLPEKEYDASIVRTVKATSQALVHFDGNIYSVPHTLANRPLCLKALPTEVSIFDERKMVARHKRSYERGIVTENEKHFEGLVALKKKAFACKIKDQFLSLGVLADQYLAGLLKADVNVQSHITQIMELVQAYGKIEVLQAIDRALDFKAFGAAYLKNVILQQRAARGLKEAAPIIVASKPGWTQLCVEEQNLSLYDDLFPDNLNPHQADKAGDNTNEKS